MVHTRLNEKETNPNPYINFISALPTHDPTEKESARQVLRALAAQVRPVMKAHGFSVNSFEEYEHNSVFAGRNWNAGETIELVLRRPDGTFLPTFWLMSTLCHELAHIKHMNHGSGFQTLWEKLNAEVRSLQDKGYYGDGYWSSGTRLTDSSRVAGEGIAAEDLPEYVCGGAQSRRRPATLRQRKPRDTTSIASTKSGRQTAKPRKAGARVKSKNTFIGEGTSLVERDGEGKIKGKGMGFGKQAASKRAREERALAIERRLRALEGQREASTSTLEPPSEPQSTHDISEMDDLEDDDETDYDRRQTLLSSEQDDDLHELKSGTLWESIESGFNIRRKDSPGCDLPVYSRSVGTSGNSTLPKGKRKRSENDDPEVTKKPPTRLLTVSLGIGKLVESEIDLRKKESLGMAPVKGGGRTLGAHTWESPGSMPKTTQKPPSGLQWNCLVCTFINEASHLACSVCTAPRGEETWSGR